jgi:hypothetical protein
VEPRNVGANGDDLTCELVAWDKWKTGPEFALMNVQVGPTQATGMDADERLIRCGLRVGCISVRE